MKKWIKYLLPAVLVIAIIWIAGHRACNLYDEYSELKGQYESLDAEYEKYRVSTVAEIEELLQQIAQKDEIISTISEEVEEKYTEIEELHGISEQLESTYTKLTDNLEKVDNLEQQVAIWKEKFALAESVIADKDRIIFSLNEKYDTQVRVTDRYKQLYENESTLRRLAEQRIALADKKLKGLRLQLNLGKGVVIVLGAVLLWGIVS